MSFPRARFPLVLLAVLAAFVALIGIGSPVQAGPANPRDVELPQPDGSTVTARLWGDEWSHGYETVTGYTIMTDPASGYWVYAVRDLQGQLTPALSRGRVLVAGRDEPQGLQSAIRPDLPADAPNRSAAIDGLSGPNFQQNIGTQPILLIYVRYNDTPAGGSAPGNTAGSYFQSMAFGASDSIKSYYSNASFGKLNLVPAAESQGTAGDGLVEITINADHPDDTDQSRFIAADALNAADPYVNFAPFDADGDGYVSSRELHILMIIAGYEESYGTAPSPKVWAHQWWLPSGIALDGKNVASFQSLDGDPGGYFMFGELHYDHPATRGVMIHELGHDLSWPDLYDTNNADGVHAGVGDWSIMGGGSWNYTSVYGDAPAQPDAYLKYYQGWITPQKAINGQVVGLRRADQYPDAVMLGSNANGVDWEFGFHSGTGEFFLVENRQEAGLPDSSCGLLVWHIDETRSYDNRYTNSVPSRPMVGLVQADDYNDLRYNLNNGDSGDPYPGWWNNLEFGNDTGPNSRYYNGTLSNYGFTVNTASCGTTMNITLITPDVSPVISGFTPDSGPVGTYVTITGENFTGATAVSFNNVPATNFGVNSDNQITAAVPAGATDGPIRVTTSAGTGVSVEPYDVTSGPATPVINQFTPAMGWAGLRVTVRGGGFTGATAVSINNVPVTQFNVMTDGEIILAVPEGVTSGKVRVTTPGGTATSAANFTVRYPQFLPHMRK